MNALVTRKLKKSHVHNTMLLETKKTLGGSAPLKKDATEADRKATNRANCLKHCDTNGYCFSCGYEFTENHTIANYNWKTENHVEKIKFNNEIRNNTLGVRIKNKPKDKNCQGGTCIFKRTFNISGALQPNTTRTPPPCNINSGIKI